MVPLFAGAEPSVSNQLQPAELLVRPCRASATQSVFTRLRHHIALVLLLAFARVLLPDSAILALHQHEHTEHEAAHASDDALKGRTVVGEKHSHCPVDHLFNAPALPVPCFVFGVVPPGQFAQPQAVALASVWSARLVQTLCLRGPPAVV